MQLTNLTLSSVVRASSAFTSSDFRCGMRVLRPHTTRGGVKPRVFCALREPQVRRHLAALVQNLGDVNIAQASITPLNVGML